MVLGQHLKRVRIYRTCLTPDKLLVVDNCLLDVGIRLHWDFSVTPSPLNFGFGIRD